MHKLLTHQLRGLTREDGSPDAEALIAVIDRTYAEFDRERRLNDRAAKLMEEELKDANARIKKIGEQRLADALESVPSAVALLNSEGVVQNINKALASLCAGHRSSPCRGTRFADLLIALCPDTDAEFSIAQLLNGESLEFNIRGRWYLGIVNRLSDGGYALDLSDISPLKEREKVLAMARDAAESANRLKSKFLATMSHELRTPLNAILGFSEVIRDHVLGDGEKPWKKYREYAGSIHDSGSHLLLLISEVLDLSKIESGLYRLHKERFNLADLIGASLVLVKPQADRGNITIMPVRIDGEMTVEADMRAVKQVVVNLLSNAVKFTPAGGEVEITCEDAPDHVQVTIRDTGIGIEASHLENVFEPFHQGDAELARQYEGTGLGLSVSRGLMEMHGGTIALESTPGVGTTAYFRLPKQNAAGKAVEQAA